MEFKVFKGIKFLTLIIGCLLFVNPTFAENILSAVQINPINDSYQIVLKTSSKAELKKVIESKNKMFIELKDVEISPSVNTVFNNVLNVDNVVIEPTMNKGAKITFAGDNISTSKIKFEKVKPAVITPISEIKINQPINSYAPVYSEEVEETPTSAMGKASALLIKAKNSKILRKAVKKGLKGEYIICFGVFLLIVAIGAKVIKNNDDTAKVGLSQNLKEKIADTPTIEDLQDNLNTIRNQEVNSLKSDYGMRAYQQSQRNPYTSAPVRHSAGKPMAQPKKFNQKPAPKFHSQLAKKSPQNDNAEMQSNPLHSAVAEIVNKQPKPLTQNIDSIKFLESMSKIYEKNGRSDLAKGLKENIKKAQFAGTQV